VPSSPDTSIPGARESSAGDDFHVLWATRRVLGLLEPLSDLQLVVMEDLYPSEPVGLDPSLLLGVDLTQYYGGRDVATAKRVTVSQLKYSHRHPTRSWTAARLADKGSRKASTVRRLADIYSALTQDQSRDRVLDVLRIQLITNRPIGQRLSGALKAAQIELRRNPNKVSTGVLIKSLEEVHHEDLQRLHTASGLSSQAFTDFLRVLELRGSEGSRARQELEITATLGTHVKADLAHHSRALYDFVRRAGLPEGEAIGAEDVFATLGVYDRGQLFPAPAIFRGEPTDIVDTPDAARIVMALRASTDRRLVAHGNAGVGKTTTVLRLEDQLLEGSVVVALDCFGGGDYLRPAHARHLPERAVLQLCNDLAVRCRLPLLVVPPKAGPDLWLELERRLTAAAETLSQAGAELLVVIDAADNAAWAARKRSDPSFVPDIWQLKIPPGAGLVVTARSGRRDSLEAPADIDQVELTGFDEGASTTYLRFRFPDASVEECQTFHHRSQGNPRVQSYVLGAPETDSVGAAVKLAKKTPKNIFEDLWSSAVEQATDSGWALERLADLMCLTPPVSLTRLAEVASSDDSPIERFCDALVPGLRIEPEGITIQDEDFERFLEDEKLDDIQRRTGNGRLATFFASRQDDPYAATVLAEHLLGAEDYEELVRLAIEDGPPTAIVDPLSSLQVYTRRLRLALKCSTTPHDRPSAAKLLVLAARAADSDSAVVEVIRRNPELALRYGDPSSVAAVWRQDRNLHWQGPVHMRLAALRAREGDEELAETELRSTRAWLRRRSEGDHRWDIDERDLAAAMEAIFTLRGADAAFEAMFRWRPWEFVWKVAEQFIRRLVQNCPVQEVAEVIFEAHLPVQMKARLLTQLRTKWQALPAAEVQTLARRVARTHIRAEHSAGNWPIDFVEMVALIGGDQSLVLRLLRRRNLKPALPQHAPSRWEGLGDFRNSLRWAALRDSCEGREVSIEDLMPASTKDKDEPRARGQRDRMREAVEPSIPIYCRRASALIHRPRASSASRNLMEHFEAIRERSSNRWFEADYKFGTWTVLMCDILLAARGTSRDLVAKAADLAEVASGKGEVATWANMARRLIEDRRYRDQALGLVARAAHRSEERAQRASELADFLLDLVEIADPHDAELAADLYARAVKAAEGLDDSGVAALETHAHVATSLAGHEDASQFGQRMAAALVGYTSRISEDTRLPWVDTIKAITAMDAATGLAVASRWEDERVARLPDTIGWVATAAAETRFISANDALHLLFLSGEGYNRTRRSLALLDCLAAEGDRAKLAAAVEHVSLVIRRDMAGQARVDGCEALKEWAAENGLANIQAVVCLHPYIRTSEPSEPSEGPSWRRDDEEGDIETLLSGADRCKADDLVDQLGHIAELSFGDAQLTEFLHRSAAAQAPSKRVAWLDALTRLPTDGHLMHFQGTAIVAVLTKVLSEWKSAAVRTWKEKKLRPFLMANLLNFVRYPESAAAQLTSVGRLLGEDETAEMGVEGAALNIAELRPESLHALAAQVSATLPPEDTARFLDWSLLQLELDTEVADPVASKNPVDALGGFLWAQFSNPEKQVRWRAAHAARGMILSGQHGADLASALLKRAETRDGGDFTSPELDFLWVSAQVWVYMTLARVAGDQPGILAKQQTIFRDVALSVQWPHAVVREFARRAALRIGGTTEVAQDESETLGLANRATSSFYPRGRTYDHLPGIDRGSTRWSFDMDTESYWFGFGDQVFRIGTGEIAARAERWLLDVLGEDPDRDIWRHDPRIQERDYGEISHHHGSLPRIENSTLALEYAAMHLVAGELIAERRPVVVENYEPVTDPWFEWLGRYLEEREDNWMIDLRSPTPAEADFLEVQLEERHWPKVNDDHLEVLLGHPDSECLAVDGYVSYRSEVGWGSDSLHSAFVEPSTAASLIRAMESAEHMSFFPFPFAEENGEEYGNAIDAPPFRLLGWLSEYHRDREGIETDDHLARISSGYVLPSDDFVKHQRAALNRKTRQILGPDGQVLAWVRAFSDQPPSDRERYQHGFWSSGHQTFVRTDALLSYLRSTGLALVMKAEMMRRIDSRREPDGGNEQEIQRVLLISGDGKFEGLRRNHSLR
jgi:hypothetical protein